jgi:hypothetical protein
VTIVELRQYTLVPGGRDTLVSIFDRWFVEGQEAEGMRIVGQFRDLDRPDRFVWVREFPSMAARHEALTAFYSGPVWKAHRDEANATMIDSNDVLLMRAVRPFTGLRPRDTAVTPGTIVAVLQPLAGREVETYAGAFVPPAGVELLGSCQTIHEANTFPALPVRENEDVFVWFARDAAIDPAGAQVLRLAPTPRSALR